MRLYLVEHGGEITIQVAVDCEYPPVSRSQAKVLMARMDEYKTVILDFEGIDIIGQGFADQIFRIFAREHPEVELIVRNTSRDVRKMITMAKNALERERA